VAVAADSTAVTEAFLHRRAQGPADVFDRVVAVDVQVALAPHGEIDERVPGQQREHVVEEAEAGLGVGPAGAIEVDRQHDVGFGGLAGNGGGAWHGVGFAARDAEAS
jgi:hypothetical protein